LLADGLIVEPLDGVVDAILLDPLQQALQQGDVAERTGVSWPPPARPISRRLRARNSASRSSSDRTRSIGRVPRATARMASSSWKRFTS
jgi:hypothetical protein